MTLAAAYLTVRYTLWAATQRDRGFFEAMDAVAALLTARAREEAILELDEVVASLARAGSPKMIKACKRLKELDALIEETAP